MGRAFVSSSSQLTAIIARRECKAHVCCLCSPKMTREGAEGNMLLFPLQPFSTQHVQGPWQRGRSCSCKASSNSRHPVLVQYRGDRLWPPPAWRQAISHLEPVLVLPPWSPAPCNGYLGLGPTVAIMVHLVQILSKTKQMQGIVLLWWEGYVGGTKKSLQALFWSKGWGKVWSLLSPWLRNRWRRQQLETLAPMGYLLSHHLQGFGGKKAQGGIIKEGLLRWGPLGSTAAAHTQHPLPREEAIPSHPASSSPPAFLSLTSHLASPFPVCFYTEDLNKETKGKYVCGADVKLTAHATTILPAPFFVPPLPLPTHSKGSGSPVHCTGTTTMGPSLSWLLCSSVMKTINNMSKEGRVCPEGGSQHEQDLESNIRDLFWQRVSYRLAQVCVLHKFYCVLEKTVYSQSGYSSSR